MGTAFELVTFSSLPSINLGILIMSLIRCALVLLCLVAQHTATPLNLLGPGGMHPEACGVRMRFVGFEVPNGDADQTRMDLSLCECARWCKSLGKGYVHVMYVADEKQCHCQRGVARRGEERSDTTYYVLY